MASRRLAQRLSQSCFLPLVQNELRVQLKGSLPSRIEGSALALTRSGRPFSSSSSACRHHRVPSIIGARRFLSLQSSLGDISNISTDDENIEEAEIVRETKTSSVSRNQQRRLAEEERLEQLEEQLTKALQEYQQLLACHTDEDDIYQRQELRDALIRLRNIYESLEYWDQVLTLETVLLDEHGASLTTAEHADTLYRQGKLHMRMGDLSQASRLYQQALSMLQDLHAVDNEHAPAVGNVMISMAGILFHRGRLEESLQLLIDAEPYFEQTASGNKDHIDLVKCLQHQGLLHRSLQDFTSASEKYQQALDVLEKLQDEFEQEVFHEKRQGLQLDLADMLAALDQNELACELYELILAHDKEFQTTSEPTALEGIILHNLGRIHAQNESTRELALEELTRALELKQEFVGDTHPEVLKTLNALGALYAVMKHQSKALQCFQQSLLLARMHANDEDDEEVMLIMRNISVLKGEKVAKWGEE